MRTVCRAVAAAVLVATGWAPPLEGGEVFGDLEARLVDLRERYDDRMALSEVALAIRGAQAPTASANDFIVNNDGFGGASNQSQIRVIQQPDGGTVAIWTDDRDANLSVYGQVFDPAGTPIGANFRLHSDPNNLNQFDPAIVVRPDGGFYAAFTEARTGGDRDVLVQRYSRLGQRLGAAVNVSANPALLIQRRPALALFSNGDLLVVYEQDSVPSNSSIFGQLLAADNLARRGSRIAVSADLAIGPLRFIYDEREPSVAIGPNDIAWVTWTDNRDGGVRDVFHQRLRRGGGDSVVRIAAAVKVNDEPLAANTFQKTPQVAVAANDRALVVWADYRRGQWDIFKQSYFTSGVRIDVNMLVNFDDVSVQDQTDPAVAWVDTIGVVVFKDFRGGKARTFAQRYDQNGSGVGNNFAVGPATAANQLAPAAAMLASGVLAVAWTQQVAGLTTAYMRPVSPSNVLGPERTVAEIVISAKQIRPACAMSAGREIFAVWEDSRAALPNIIGQALTNTLAKPQGDQLVNGGRPTFHFLPATSVGGSTGFAVWEDYRDTLIPVYSDIYLQRYTLTASGYAASGGNVRVIDTVESPTVRLASWNPDVASDGTGRTLVVWQDDRLQSWDIFAARYSATSSDAGGSALRIGRNFRIDQAPVFTKQELPRVDMNEAGATVVVWEDSRAAAATVELWARLYTDAGATASGSEFRLAIDALHRPRQPDVAIASDGSFAVVYEERSEIGDVDIFVQRFGATGAAVGAAIPVNDDGLSVNQILPRIAAVAGGYVVVWQDERNGNWDIYGSLIPAGTGVANANYLVNDPSGTDQTVPAITGIRSATEPFICWEDLRQTGTAPDIFGNRNAPALASGIGEERGVLPEGFALAQNVPNPFNPGTQIRYQLERGSAIRLEIYNVLGQRVRTLLDGFQPAGLQRIDWDGRDESGRALASGTYFYRLHWPEGSVTRKMTLLR